MWVAFALHAEKMWVAFALQKLLTFFSAKNFRILYIESAKTVSEMTLNELVKLTTLWTTWPRNIPTCGKPPHQIKMLHWPIWIFIIRIYHKGTFSLGGAHTVSFHSDRHGGTGEEEIYITINSHSLYIVFIAHLEYVLGMNVQHLGNLTCVIFVNPRILRSCHVTNAHEDIPNTRIDFRDRHSPKEHSRKTWLLWLWD